MYLQNFSKNLRKSSQNNKMLIWLEFFLEFSDKMAFLRMVCESKFLKGYVTKKVMKNH
jgi:hypothetical protein